MLRKFVALSLIMAFPLFGFTNIDDSNRLQSAVNYGPTAAAEENPLALYEAIVEESYSCKPMPYYEIDRTQIGIQRYDVPLQKKSSDEKDFKSINYYGNDGT